MIFHQSGSDFLVLNSLSRYLICLINPFIFSYILLGIFPWSDLDLAFKIFISFFTCFVIWLNYQKILQSHKEYLIITLSYFNRLLFFALIIFSSYYLQLLYFNITSFICYFLSLWLCLSIFNNGLLYLTKFSIFRKPNENIAIIGITPSSITLADLLIKQKYSILNFIGFFDDRQGSRVNPHCYKHLGAISEINNIEKQFSLNHSVISLENWQVSNNRLDYVFNCLLNTTSSIHYMHNFINFRPIREGVSNIAGISLFTLVDSPQNSAEQHVKRLFDIILAVIALFFLAPLFLIVAIIIKIESPGTVFFRQLRWGEDGKSFMIYKFRSMNSQVSAAAMNGAGIIQASKNDPRITKFGKFIRRSSIDELPQIINILLGNMSFVGPRPHAVSHNEQYRSLVKGYMQRHKIKPGLSGWAQIHGFRGETETLEKMEQRVAYDLEYIRIWTPWLDLYIILRTIWLVISAKNAY